MGMTSGSRASDQYLAWPMRWLEMGDMVESIFHIWVGFGSATLYFFLLFYFSLFSIFLKGHAKIVQNDGMWL